MESSKSKIIDAFENKMDDYIHHDRMRKLEEAALAKDREVRRREALRSKGRTQRGTNKNAHPRRAVTEMNAVSGKEKIDPVSFKETKRMRCH